MNRPGSRSTSLRFHRTRWRPHLLGIQTIRGHFGFPARDHCMFSSSACVPRNRAPDRTAKIPRRGMPRHRWLRAACPYSCEGASIPTAPRPLECIAPERETALSVSGLKTVADGIECTLRRHGNLARGRLRLEFEPLYLLAQFDKQPSGPRDTLYMQVFIATRDPNCEAIKLEIDARIHQRTVALS